MKERLIKETQTIITVFYLVTVGIGMLFSYQKYSNFGINIFDYADVFDFLIAPFSDVKILLFSFASIATLGLFFGLNLLWKRKFPNSYNRMSFGSSKQKWFNPLYYALLTFGFLYYLYVGAIIYGAISKEQIEKEATILLRFSDDEILRGKVIGKTKEVIFMLSNKKVKAIPITSLVKEIEVK